MSSVAGLLTPNKYDLYCDRLEAEVLRTDELLIGAFQPLKGATLVSNGTSFMPVSVGADGEILIADSAEPEGVRWTAPPAPGTGDVVGPASSTDDHVATFDGATGKLIQDSGVRIVSGGTNSFAIGNGAAAAGSHAIALGNGATANLAGSVAIGNGAAVDFTHTYSITGQVLTPVPGGSGTLGSFHNVKINGIDYFVPLYTVAGSIGGANSYINIAQTGVGATATPVAVPGTYYKLGLSAANATENSGWSSTVDGRITYLGAETKIFNVAAVTSLVNIAAGTKNVSIIIYKDGAPVATTASYVDLVSQTDPTHVNAQGLISMSTNNYLEVYVTNHTDTNAVAATEFNLLAVAVN